MSFWDGTRWVDDVGPRATPPLASLRAVATLALIVGLVGAGLVGFSAAPNATLGAQGTLTLSPTSGPPGSTIVVVGAGLGPRMRVQLTWDGAAAGLPVVTTDRQGDLRASFPAPSAAPGGHTVGVTRATGRRQLLASVVFVIVAGTGPTSAPGTTPPPGAIAPIPPVPTVAPGTSPAPSAGSSLPPGTSTPSPTSGSTAAPTVAPSAAPPATPVPTVTPAPTRAPTPAPTVAPAARLLFGLGSQAEAARVSPLTKNAPIRILSSWYNGPNDLAWITDSWHRSIFLDAYAAGFELHLITWTPEPETRFAASTGAVCGRAYPLSDRWLDDMRRLAQAFSGPASGPALYVTLFTEFQTYPCVENAWDANAETNAYYRALISQYEKGVAIFHQYAPNARVSLGWGGWQASYDDPAIGGGRSMIPYFAGAMDRSDFVSFQAMHGVSNVQHIRDMTRVLGAYGPVMLAHHMPDADTNSLSTVYATFQDDVRTLLTSTEVARLVDDGLFAWSFLDDKPMQASTTTYSIVEAGVKAFGR